MSFEPCLEIYPKEIKGAKKKLYIKTFYGQMFNSKKTGKKLNV